MPAPFYNILSKCDRALVAYLISEGAGAAANVFPEKRNSLVKTLPVTLVWSRHAKPEGSPYSGIYRVTALVMVRGLGVAEEQSDNENEVPAANSDLRVGLTFDAFHAFGEGAQSGDELADSITAAARASAVSPRDKDLADFTVQSVEVMEMDSGLEARGDAWADAIHLEIVCNVSNTSG